MSSRRLSAVPAGVAGPIAEAIAGIPASALECRRRRSHRWGPYTAQYDRRERIWRETEECDRCESRRTSHVDDAGHQVDAWRYEYPPGYLVPGGLMDDARAYLRLEALRRRSR